MAMPWWGLNLAPLNADLGRYFGTDKGVLVIAADQESLPGIRAGDVITSIAGEPIDRPEDALRALRDQASGKEVPIKILRDRKTLALNMKAPAFNSIFDLRAAPPTPPRRRACLPLQRLRRCPRRRHRHRRRPLPYRRRLPRRQRRLRHRLRPPEHVGFLRMGAAFRYETASSSCQRE